LTHRRVIALGAAASDACRRHGVKCNPARHPSARGLRHFDKARELAALIKGG
jgi:hypothetical protein